MKIGCLRALPLCHNFPLGRLMTFNLRSRSPRLKLSRSSDGLPDLLNPFDTSPVSYLDSIMNGKPRHLVCRDTLIVSIVPMFDFSQENGFL